MTNDEQNKTQQSLPLSWEEESQNNMEEQLAPKKLLLKNNNSTTEPPKPLLLKKANPTTSNTENDPAQNETVADYNNLVNENEYRHQLDKFDTIYDAEVKSPPEEVEEDFNYEDENELNNLLAQEDQVDDEVNQKNSTNLALEQETDLQDEEDIDDEEEDIVNKNSQNNLSQNSSTSYSFQDSGTFTINEKVEDEQLSNEEEIIEKNEFENEDEETENDSALEKVVNTPAHTKNDSVNTLPNQTESKRLNIPDESVFALKADTFFDVNRYASESNINETNFLDTKEIVHDNETQSFGALLQEARLAQNFTIKDAAEKTRIKSGYIVSLENNEFDNLPPKVYTMNYIRQLCREYNTPTGPIIKAFEELYNNPSNEEQSIMRVGDDEARRATSPEGKLHKILIASGLLALLVLFLLGYYMKWLSPSANLGEVKVDVNLEAVKPEIKLPAPELPIPTR